MKGSSAAHSKLVNKAILTFQNEKTRLWKNHVGLAYDMDSVKAILRANFLIDQEPKIRKIKFGVPGSPDIEGIKEVEITQDMVGHTIGMWIGFEVKTGKAKQSPNQKAFQKMIESLKGLYNVISG